MDELAAGKAGATCDKVPADPFARISSKPLCALTIIEANPVLFPFFFLENSQSLFCLVRFTSLSNLNMHIHVDRYDLSGAGLGDSIPDLPRQLVT